MKKIKYETLIPMIIFFIISMISIKVCANSQILSKQIIWYLIGFLILIFTPHKITDKIIKHANILYIINVLLLVLLLFFGSEVNGSKCWFSIPKIGSFQPSEFMKIILILYNAKILSEHKRSSLKEDIRIFSYIMLVTLIPSVLTFLQPDTGMVIIYFLISLTMLYIHGIRKSIFIVIVTIFILLVSLFLYFYFNYQDNFISIFGTSFFYRIDRLLDWSNKSGMQLTNAITLIKASGIFGFGASSMPLYVPEAHTDFIFSVFSSLFGLIGTLILIFSILVFDYGLLKEVKHGGIKKYIVIGFLSMILYQQVQNIGMNIGLLPITGITLPFISYGGSSLLSYFILITIILK